MEPVLIYKDEEQIREEKQHLDNVITHLQSLYNEFKNISIDVTLTELVRLGNYQRNITKSMREKSIEDFVVNYLIVKTGEPSFNGIKISREKLADMIEKPNLNGVFEVLNMAENRRRDKTSIVEAWLKLDNDVVSKSDNAYDLIDALYTYYSTNDFGAILTTKILDLCGTMNTYQAFCVESGMPSGAQASGIEFKNKIHRPSLDFIRTQEEIHRTFVTV